MYKDYVLAQSSSLAGAGKDVTYHQMPDGDTAMATQRGPKA